MAERPPQHGDAPGRRTARMASSVRWERTLVLPFRPETAAATCGERFYSDLSMPQAPRPKNEEDPEGGES